MTENPYQSSKDSHGDAPPKPIIPFLGRLVIYGAIIALVIALLLPAVRGGREAPRRSACLNNTKQILLALQSYHDANGELPPAYTVDADGNRLHSWRSLILPYMEGERVHKLIDYTKPWDDPANAKARESIVDAYLCPSSMVDDQHLSNYLCVTGPEFLFDGSTPRTLADVKDGPSNTIAIIEVSAGHAVHWMSPEDADETLILNTERALSVNHVGVFVVGYLDGHAAALSEDIDRDELRAQLTIAGREVWDEQLETFRAGPAEPAN